MQQSVNRTCAGLAVGVLVAVLAVAAQARYPLDLGDAAPAFELRDHHGETVRLADFEGDIVVLEWFCSTCPAVVYHHDPERRTMSGLAEEYADEGVTWLAINSSHDEDEQTNAEFAEKWDVSYPILSDPSGEVGKAYGARTTPHLFVIDAEGKIAYRGAVDDDPGRRGDAEVNYVQQAIESLLAEQPLSDPEIPPYGCRVKYAR